MVLKWVALTVSHFLVLPTACSQDPCTDFHDQYVKWRVSRKDVPIGRPENKILHCDPISSQQTQIFRQYSTELGKFRVKKALTMRMLACKLPYIVIVAQWKLYSE